MAPVYLCYDERMLLHRPVGWKEPKSYPDRYGDKVGVNYPVENPERIKCVFQRLMQLEERLMASKRPFLSPASAIFLPVVSSEVPRETVLLAHSAKHYDKLERTQSDLEQSLLAERVRNDSDIYICPETFAAARLAAGGLLKCVLVTTGAVPSYSNRALALLRPPGHHACQAKEMGFCFFNSIAIAAKYALHHKLATRVLILDYDVHHGNGTQELTYDDENILFVSLHRYTGMNGGMAPDRPEPAAGDFFPYTGHPEDTGGPQAEGSNVNVAWTKGGMGNCEYAAAFCEVVLPLIAGFQPDLVLVSCGVDAAAGDLIGDCLLSPEFFYAMTRSLLTLIGNEVPIIHALEGGYAMQVLADCIEAVTLALLGERYDCDARTFEDCNDHLVSLDNTTTATAVMDHHLHNHHHHHHHHHHSPFTVGGVVKKMKTDMCVPRRLVMARSVFAPYWKRDGYGGNIRERAVRDINKTVSALQKTGCWKQINLRKLKLSHEGTGIALRQKRDRDNTNTNNTDNNSDHQQQKGGGNASDDDAAAAVAQKKAREGQSMSGTHETYAAFGLVSLSHEADDS